MRYAVLGLLLFVLAAAGGVAGLVVADVTLDEMRDVVIIVYGAMGVLLLVALSHRRARPLAGGAHAHPAPSATCWRTRCDPPSTRSAPTARNVRGASEFVADAAVHPLIRVLSVGRGMRRGARHRHRHHTQTAMRRR